MSKNFLPLACRTVITAKTLTEFVAKQEKTEPGRLNWVRRARGVDEVHQTTAMTQPKVVDLIPYELS